MLEQSQCESRWPMQECSRSRTCPIAMTRWMSPKHHKHVLQMRQPLQTVALGKVSPKNMNMGPSLSSCTGNHRPSCITRNSESCRVTQGGNTWYKKRKWQMVLCTIKASRELVIIIKLYETDYPVDKCIRFLQYNG